MTQIFYCNFNRVLEKKEELDNETTIHYYQANRLLMNLTACAEILYCLTCMILFLLVIYWDAKQQTHVILGKEQERVQLEVDDIETNSVNNRFSRKINQDIKRMEIMMRLNNRDDLPGL